eukprot:5010385-Lingulodinium_polyedra.AAC.1
MVSEDFRKFYEHIEWAKLRAECARWGFPEAFARCAIGAYGAERFLSQAGMVLVVGRATRTVVAGCGKATTLVK